VSEPRSDEHPSEALIRRATAGDRTALEQLLAAHLPGLRGFIRLQAGRLLRAKESASDLAQSVCREALEDLTEFDYRGEAAFRHWLFKRAHRKILRRHEYYSAQKRDAAREHPADASADDELLAAYRTLCTPSRELMDRQAVERIEAAMDRLPEDQRQAITLHRLVGLPHKDIASELGKTEGAVRNLVYRGLARLGMLLAEGAQ